jgi:RimJ/RimL family protein N-acetyltransferase
MEMLSTPAERAAAMVRGRLVHLRPTEPGDVELFLRWLNDAEVTQHLASRAPLGRAYEERWIERLLESHGKDTYHFVICRLDDGEPIGSVALDELDLVNGSAGVGIVIGEKGLWGMGYGTDAMDAVLDFGFGQLRLERVWLDVFVGNDRAVASYRKSGFVLEGTLRSAHFTRGRHVDVQRMAVLREEWAAVERPRSWDLNGAAAP